MRSSSNRSTRLFAAALVATALLAGCGGDGDGGGDGSTTGASGDGTLNHHDFISTADQICKEGNRQIETAATEGLPPGRQRPSVARRFVRVSVIPATESQIEQIRALKAPKEDEQEAKAFVAAAQEGLAKAKSNPDLLAGRGPDPFAEAKQIAAQLGMKECSTG
jgi:hypothetical protein